MATTEERVGGWTEEGAVRAGLAWMREHGRFPTSIDANRAGAMALPSFDHVTGLFGTWTAYRRSMEAAIDAAPLEEREKAEDEPQPAVTGVMQADPPADPPFGAADPPRSSSADAANPYGLKKAGRGYAWTPEIAIQAVCDFAAREGRPPQFEDAREHHGRLPHPATAQRLFGSWDDLVRAAGLQPALNRAPRTKTGPAAPPRVSSTSRRSGPAAAAESGASGGASTTSEGPDEPEQPDSPAGAPATPAAVPPDPEPITVAIDLDVLRDRLNARAVWSADDVLALVEELLHA